MTVGVGQLGMHLLWDWHVNGNIGIVNVWNLNSVFSISGAGSSFDHNDMIPVDRHGKRRRQHRGHRLAIGLDR